MDTTMHRIQYDRYPNDPDKIVLPCECFDMIGGSDMGGTVAIMLSKLCMSIEDVTIECHQICSTVYMVGLSPEERCLRLRQYIEGLLERKGLPLNLKLGRDSRMIEEGCPCFVLATLKSSMNIRVKLRSYRTRTESTPDITVVEAILATCAMQPDFTPISIGPTSNKQELVGGAMGAGNPCRELVLEAFDKFGQESRVSTILSIGNGHHGLLVPPEQGGSGEWNEVFREMAVNCEEVSQSMQMQTGHLGVYFRFSVDQGLQKHHGDNVNDAGWLISQTQAYLQETEVSQRLDQCIESLRLRQGLVTLEQLKHTGSYAIYKDVPTLTTYFVMREEPYNSMKRLLDEDSLVRKQHVLVISGMAGCGKTQLLIHFTNEFRSRFRHVFFVDATSKESIQADLINHVRTSSPAYSQATFTDVLSFFSNPQNLPWLITYDNCDDIELDLQSLIPDCSHGSIIITTRDRSRGYLTSDPELHLELDVMSDDEAIEVILKSSRLQNSEENRNSASTIAKELGNLPVALAQAGSYIFKTSCTCAEYLRLVCNSKAELMKIPTADRRHRGAYAAFDLSYKRLPTRVQNFLHLIGCLHFANFPTVAIRIAVQTQFRNVPYKFEPQDARFEESVSLLMDTFCPEGSWSELSLHEMTQTLQHYSLASFTQSYITSLLRMHPLLHEWAFQRLPADKKISFLSSASRLIACVSKEESLHPYLIGHIEVLLSPHTDWEVGINDQGAFGYVQRRDKVRKLEESQKTWEGIYKRMVKDHGNLDVRVATAAFELAQTFRNNLDIMEQFEREAIAIREQLLGPEHLETLASKAALAGTYQRQRRLEEAESLRSTVLEAKRRTLGPEHEETIASEHWLAQIYYSQERFAEAQMLQEQVLKVRRERLGDIHSDTLWAMSNLAKTYRSEGIYSRAQELQERVLKVRKVQLGETHPDTVDARNNLASTYYSLNCFSDAQEIQEQVLEGQKMRLGDTHSDTLLAMSNLAKTYHSLKRYSDAQQLQEHVFEVLKERLGESHMESISAMHELASTYYSLRSYSDAAQLQEKVLRERRLKNNHRETATAMYNLALSYCDLGQLTQARELAVEGEKTARETFGINHPDYQKFVSLLKETDAALAKVQSVSALNTTGRLRLFIQQLFGQI